MNIVPENSLPFQETDMFIIVKISYRRCSVKTGLLRNFAKFRALVSLAQVFSSELCEISKRTCFYKTRPNDCF